MFVVVNAPFLFVVLVVVLERGGGGGSVEIRCRISFKYLIQESKFFLLPIWLFSFFFIFLFFFSR